MNGCGIAVGIVVAGCDGSELECKTRSIWRYRSDGMLLPARWQRPVTHAEETQFGRRIRYIACVIAEPSANDTFAHSEDSCIERVRRWSAAAGDSAPSLDAFFGSGLPANTHESL